MAKIIPGLENVDWFPIVGQLIYWTTIILVAILIIGLIVVGWYLWQFKIKATVIPMYGSGKDGTFSFAKPRGNRVKWINRRTAWKSLKPFPNRKEREPFDSEYIYPGNRIFVFELNDEWIPGRINVEIENKERKPLPGEKEDIKREVRIFLAKKYKHQKWVPGKIDIDKSEREIRADINPVPYYVRNWQSLEHKKNAMEFAKQGFWEENKYFIITLLTVFACCVLAGSVIYFTYKFAGAGRADIQMLTSAMNRIGEITGSTGAPR